MARYVGHLVALGVRQARRGKSGPVFCLLLGVSSDYAQPITGVTCPVIGQAQPERTPSKRQKTGPGHGQSSGQVVVAIF